MSCASPRGRTMLSLVRARVTRAPSRSLRLTQHIVRGRFASSYPVGIFVDLDNIGPELHGRADAEAFVQPLKAFAQSAGTTTQFDAFGNLATRSYAASAEHIRRESMLDEQEYAGWDGSSAQTGYDPKGLLRCGVCGAKMTVTKKQAKAGMAPEKKLAKHMRELHDREQNKRNNRRGKLKGKMLEKSRKYVASQVGFRSGPRAGRNDLFTVLREQGVRCKPADNVDSALIRAARVWMAALPLPVESDAGLETRGCLMVVSEDADFAPLLREARQQHVLAVSVTPDSLQQTSRLAAAADIVLLQGDEDEGFDEPVYGSSIDASVPSSYVLEAQTDPGRRLTDDPRFSAAWDSKRLNVTEMQRKQHEMQKQREDRYLDTFEKSSFAETTLPTFTKEELIERYTIKVEVPDPLPPIPKSFSTHAAAIEEYIVGSWLPMYPDGARVRKLQRDLSFRGLKTVMSRKTMSTLMPLSRKKMTIEEVLPFVYSLASRGVITLEKKFFKKRFDGEDRNGGSATNSNPAELKVVPPQTEEETASKVEARVQTHLEREERQTRRAAKAAKDAMFPTKARRDNLKRKASKRLNRRG